MSEENRIQIRSYRVCFDLERRIHKIDRWQLPLPYGVPLRGIAYWAVILVAVLIAQALPVSGQLLGLLHPGLRFGVLPIGAAALLVRWNLDGRNAHAVAISWLRLALAPKRIAAFRPAPLGVVSVPGVAAIAPDERSSRLRRAVVSGPARVVFRYPTRNSRRGHSLRVSQVGGEASWRGTEVSLRPGQRVVVK